MSDLDRFLSRKNIERYRKLLDSSINEAQRRQILELLAEEERKLKQELCTRTK